jgi:hypothetical protein
MLVNVPEVVMTYDKNKRITKFEGFDSPKYTQVPDQLFDELLTQLTGAELKVLLYIIRRTFGFKKDADSISLSQLMYGITTKDGRILDSGVGISKPTLLSALRSLKDMNIVATERRRSVDKGDEPTVYMLNIKGTPGKVILPGGGKESLPGPWSNNLTTQETVLQQTEQQETDHSNLRMASPSQEKQIKSPPETLVNNHITANSAELPPEGDPEENDEDREVIRAYVEDFGRELGDQSKLRSSVSRACNLYKKSGVSRDIFIARMYEAKSITQERTADIRNHRQEDGKALPKKSKMAYWFATLSNLLEGKVPPRRRSRQETPESITP